MADPPVLYEVDGDRFLPTQYTAGPWSPDLQHAGPPTALLARAIHKGVRPLFAEGPANGRLSPGGGEKGVRPLLGRLTADIWRPVPIAPLVIETRVVRPGKKVQQLAATLREAEGGKELMRATAWFLQHNPLEGAPEPEPPPRHPDECKPVRLPWWDDEIAYHAALDWRLASGAIDDPGPACVWTRMRIPLVPGEAPTPLEHLLVMGDAASGVSWELDWATHSFVNVDFSVHLERAPEGEWLAMEAVTRPGPDGAGQTTSVLSDLRGRIGFTSQTLVIARNA